MTSDTAWLNEIHLIGRVSGEPHTRTMPSGDELVSLRVVVPRPRKGSERQQVDVLDVSCWSARTRRRARTLAVDDVVEISGALRRRFFRAGGGGAQSRHDVEASTLKRVPAPPS